mgnify:CR=1 FL=1
MPFKGYPSKGFKGQMRWQPTCLRGTCQTSGLAIEWCHSTAAFITLQEVKLVIRSRVPLSGISILLRWCFKGVPFKGYLSKVGSLQPPQAGRCCVHDRRVCAVACMRQQLEHFHWYFDKGIKLRRPENLTLNKEACSPIVFTGFRRP